MIAMWDRSFTSQNPDIAAALDEARGWEAFESMHRILDATWKELARVLVDGGIACINIGDATRTVGGSFALFPNHARIVTAFLELGLTPLPVILWRKQTNAPNKFMGSGMLPPGAYVTLEHEYVLIFRKGDKRAFPSAEDKANRHVSSYFWEERNQWFSDVWFDLKGSRQELVRAEVRSRSGAFPFELPYRLINMFSTKGDVVLDPFLGTGTTTLAAMATGRHSVGYEVDASLQPIIEERARTAAKVANDRVEERLADHASFVRRRFEAKGPFKHRNEHYHFPVVTRQEAGLLLDTVASVEACVNSNSAAAFRVSYDAPRPAVPEGTWDDFLSTPAKPETPPVADSKERDQKHSASPRPASPSIRKVEWQNHESKT